MQSGRPADQRWMGIREDASGEPQGGSGTGAVAAGAGSGTGSSASNAFKDGELLKDPDFIKIFLAVLPLLYLYYYLYFLHF